MIKIKRLLSESASTFFKKQKDAEGAAMSISKEEGIVQHVNKTSGGFEVSDWYDEDSTVSSYENGQSK